LKDVKSWRLGELPLEELERSRLPLIISRIRGEEEYLHQRSIHPTERITDPEKRILKIKSTGRINHARGRSQRAHVSLGGNLIMGNRQELYNTNAYGLAVL